MAEAARRGLQHSQVNAASREGQAQTPCPGADRDALPRKQKPLSE